MEANLNEMREEIANKFNSLVNTMDNCQAKHHGDPLVVLDADMAGRLVKELRWSLVKLMCLESHELGIKTAPVKLARLTIEPSKNALLC